MNTQLLSQLQAAIKSGEVDLDLVEKVRDLLHEISPTRAQPVDRVRWIPIEKVEANDYNPNSVAKVEMGLLYTSIKHDGYTQPVVTVYDGERDRYVIVDGFHRYTTMRTNPDILAACGGRLPVVVIAKSINDRMASTVRHNRARGRHSITGMSNMVFEMLQNGWSDAEICAELGMEVEELVRLKHVTGFSKLFESAEYQKAWETRRQIKMRKEYYDANPDESDPMKGK